MTEILGFSIIRNMTPVDWKIEEGWVFLYHPQKGLRLEVTDLYVHEGQIVAIGLGHGLKAKQKFKAKGLLVSPGFIDSQVHWREPGLTHKETIRSGSLASLFGGVTSALDMPNTIPPTIDETSWQDKMNRAQQGCYTHYAFYLGFGDDANLSDVTRLAFHPQVPGIKVFLAQSFNLGLKNWNLIETLYQAKVPLILVHAENESIIQAQKKHFRPDVLYHHQIRSPESAIQATKFILDLALRYPQTKTHILHVSTAQEALMLREAPAHLSFELLPQHLFFEAPVCYQNLGSLVQQNPPIREKSHREILLQAAKEGWNRTFASDHAPHTLEEKMLPYPLSPSGIPAGELWTSVLLTLALTHKWNLITILDRMTGKVAELLGIKSKKGRITPGFDADLTFVDLKKAWKVEKSLLHSAVGWSPWEGQTLYGFIQGVFLKGRCVIWDRSLIDPQCYGEPLVFERSNH